MSSDSNILRDYLNADTAATGVNIPTCNSGKTALHLAAWKGSIENIRVLLDFGADLNQWSTGIGNFGKTAIFYAITQCRDDVVMELLNRGAWVKIINNKGQSPRSLAATHCKEETVRAIELAEEQQKDLEWLNFRQTNSDNRFYGDLDPRFNQDEIGAQLVGQNHSPLSPEIPSKCIFPTTYESRRNYRIRQYAQETYLFSPSSKLPINDVEGGYFSKVVPSPDTATGLVDLIGIISGKRQLSRTLLFADLMPLDLDSKKKMSSQSDVEEHIGESFKRNRFAWTVKCDGKDYPCWIQLIIGKTIRNTFGDEAAAAICKGVKVGQVVQVRGKLSEQIGSANISGIFRSSSDDDQSPGPTCKAMEMAVHQVNIIFNETAAKDAVAEANKAVLSARNRSPKLPSNLSTPNTASVEESPSKTDSPIDAGIMSLSNDFLMESLENKPTPKQVAIAEYSPSNFSQFLSLKQILGSQHFIELPTVTSKYNEKQVTENTVLIIDDEKGLQSFAAMISSLEDDVAAQASPVAALDSEWRPASLYEDANTINQITGEQTDDSSVAILQIATRRHIMILDLQILMTLPEDQKECLDSCLSRLFGNSLIVKLGFEVGQDLQKLAASFPSLSSLQTVSNVVDIRRFAHQLFTLPLPAAQKNETAENSTVVKVSSLSKLCKSLLGKELDKSQQCSAWHQRPLDLNQVPLFLSHFLDF